MTDATEHEMRRLVDPGSVAWKVNRESVLLLGGRRALLMQLAHPLVAQAVADHSRFVQDRVGRLLKTLQLSFAIVFGEPGEAEAAIKTINAVHAAVSGVLPQRAGAFPPGTSYRAEDPELLLWVHATLVDSALMFYERFVRALTEDERESFYRDTKRGTDRLGIPPDVLPADHRAFTEYLESMIASEKVIVTPVARGLGEEILYPPAKWIPRRLVDPLNIITIGTLPPAIREGYGLRWNWMRAAGLSAATVAVRGAVALAPRRIRFVPPARKAEQRLERRTDEKPL